MSKNGLILCSLLQVKKPGLEMETVQSELDLSYRQRYQAVTIPEAYERLILDSYAPLMTSSLIVYGFFVENRHLKVLKEYTRIWIT